MKYLKELLIVTLFVINGVISAQISTLGITPTLVYNTSGSATGIGIQINVNYPIEDKIGLQTNLTFAALAEGSTTSGNNSILRGKTSTLVGIEENIFLFLSKSIVVGAGLGYPIFNSKNAGGTDSNSNELIHKSYEESTILSANISVQFITKIFDGIEGNLLIKDVLFPVFTKNTYLNTNTNKTFSEESTEWLNNVLVGLGILVSL